ncbi:MAG TPA: D-tagatose-bisphosphate aldolase, class II, non-catalytic subunit [Acetobacteraceae bacterium]|nr:D-tagatose-bisphosphate aldolase, class II, non-catalytic subunit [Acetobacteraceae bacterium]
MSAHPLAALGRGRGLTSVCSAHPLVIEAALTEAKAASAPALIEATCNQVNQEGGYTGLTPAAFRDQVLAIADRVGLPRSQVILGGDHLGPNPWRALPAEAALGRAEAMVAAYAEAGFEKIHLDCSMGCAGEPTALPDAVTAARAARLARVAEAAAGAAGTAPRYIIGTEVPTPGGATEAIEELEVTRPEAALATHEVHRRAFAEAGLAAAFERVIALVVQPGVEFGHANVVIYRPERAVALAASLDRLPGLVFEAHSTDYQPQAALAALVRDGFAILKVGPGLTFALREALYGLDAIAAALDPDWHEHSLVAAMERVMLADPRHWRSHYHGDAGEQRVLRHFSYSDRIRYYWPAEAAQAAVARLLAHLASRPIPETLISQYLPTLYPRVLEGAVPPQPEALLHAAVRDVLAVYAAASGA